MADNVPTGGAAPSTTTQPATNTPAPEAPKPLVVGGISFKSEADAKAEIERGRQSGKLLTEAQKRLFEASKKEKEWAELTGEVKTKKDARKVIERLGLSKEEAIDVFGRWLYQEEVLPRELDPKERRIRELEAEKARFEEERANKEKAAKDEEFTQLTKKEEARLKEELTKILQSKKFPNTRIALRRLANYMASYAEAGADVPADRAADMVMEDYRQEYGELFDESTPDQLAEFFGPQRWQALAKKVSEWALSRARGNMTAAPKGSIPARTGQPVPQKQEGKMSPQEYLKFMRSVK